MSHDVIVIGAGVNGLTCAHALAKAGRRVLVLEQRPDADVATTTGWVPDQVASGLGLAAAGLRIERPDPWLTVPLEGGERLELWQDVARTAAAIGRVSPADGAKWPTFAERMRRLAGVLEALYVQPAPDVETTSPAELMRLGLLGVNVRRLGRRTIVDLLRILPMSAADLLNEWFDHDGLKAALGAAGVMHLRQGPRSQGTAFNLLHHAVGAGAGVFRPPLSNAGAALTAMKGIEIRRGERVARVSVKQGRVTGVVLRSGDEPAARCVVSSADPRATLLGMVDADWLDPQFVRAVRNIKCRGVAARVTLTLSRPVELPPTLLAASLDHLERAYDDAKHGRVSSNPWIEARATDGRIEAHVQYVPHAPDGGWSAERRDALGNLVVARLAEQVPGLHETVTGRVVVGPADLAARDGLTEGQAYHGELTLDQILFMRPVGGWSRYATPVAGLYLCGAGTHPGGGIAGGPGWLAAQTIMKEAAS